jgi:secreted trypsin-like serine protease
MVRSVFGFVRRAVRNRYVLPLLAVSALVTLASHTAMAIIDGVVDENNSFPNVCAILGPSAADHSKIIVGASSTLIHPQVVLTAGHVTRDIESALAAGMPLEALHVSFSPNAFDERSWLAVSAVITHPNYFANSVDNDLGVLILSRPVRGIKPVTLAPVGLLDSLFATGQLRDGTQESEFALVGYGDGRSFPPPEPIERDGLRRFARCEFAALSDNWLMLSMNPGSDGGGANDGDSGGPALWFDQTNNQWIQVALISWSSNPRIGNEYCWRIDLPESRAFIDSVLANLNQ